MTLTAEQTEAVDKFHRLRVGAVLMEQGSGKTRVAVELANLTPVDHVLWLGPSSTLHDVEQEFTKWELDSPVMTVSWEALSQSDRIYLDLMAWLRWNDAQGSTVMVVADESHKVKNLDAKRHGRARQARDLCQFALLLTATEITRDLWDVKRQIDWLSPRILNMSDGQFRSIYFTHVEYKKRGGKRKEFWKLYEPNVSHLMGLIEPYIYRADLRLNVAESTHSHTYQVTQLTRDKYQPLKREALRALRYATGDFPAILTRLNHVASTDPELVRGVAREAQGRCVVFTAFLDQQQALAHHIGTPYLINGDTSHANRVALRQSWEQDHLPLILTFGTGAHGLNLQAANVVHFASLTFDWAHRDHARKRVRRLGQERDMEFHYHLTDLGISRLIWDNLEHKQWLSDMVKGKVEVRL